MINYTMNNLRGYVDFVAEGAEPEKLLTFCVKNGMEIIRPRKKDYVFYGSIYAKNYKKLKKPAKKFGLKLKVIKKHGYFFWYVKNKETVFLMMGCTLIISIMLFLNLFIWNICVEGNEDIPEDDIIFSANNAGLKTGTLRKKHDTHTVEWKILNENEGLASVELNIQGSRATIVVNKAKEKAEMKSDDDVPINIVASRYGVIRKMDVFDGQDAVKIGDAVMKGDLLVSAVYEDRHNKLTLKHARANIIAETDYNIEIVFPLEQIIKTKGKLKKTISEIEILGKKIKLGNDRNFDNFITETDEKELYFFWIKLPINVITTRYFDVKENSITYNFEQGKDGAYSLLKEKEENEMKNMEIISRTVEEKIKNNKYILEANYICLMDIGEEQPIESDVPWENTDEMS